MNRIFFIIVFMVFGLQAQGGRTLNWPRDTMKIYKVIVNGLTPGSLVGVGGSNQLIDTSLSSIPFSDSTRAAHVADTAFKAGWSKFADSARAAHVADIADSSRACHLADSAAKPGIHGLNDAAYHLTSGITQYYLMRAGPGGLPEQSSIEDDGFSTVFHSVGIVLDDGSVKNPHISSGRGLGFQPEITFFYGTHDTSSVINLESNYVGLCGVSTYGWGVTVGSNMIIDTSTETSSIRNMLGLRGKSHTWYQGMADASGGESSFTFAYDDADSVKASLSPEGYLKLGVHGLLAWGAEAPLHVVGKALVNGPIYCDSLTFDGLHYLTSYKDTTFPCSLYETTTYKATANCHIVKVGRHVTATFGTMTESLGGASISIRGIPTAFRPSTGASGRYVPVMVRENSATIPGFIVFNASFPLVVNSGGSSLASGTGGIFETSASWIK